MKWIALFLMSMIAPVAFAGFTTSDATAAKASCCCGAACVCESCTCVADGCACDQGGPCVCNCCADGVCGTAAAAVKPASDVAAKTSASCATACCSAK